MWSSLPFLGREPCSLLSPVGSQSTWPIESTSTQWLTGRREYGREKKIIMARYWMHPLKLNLKWEWNISLLLYLRQLSEGLCKSASQSPESDESGKRAIWKISLSKTIRKCPFSFSLERKGNQIITVLANIWPVEQRRKKNCPH